MSHGRILPLVAVMISALLLLCRNAFAEPPPPEALALMPPKAISLRWEPRDFGGERVWFHHYVTPRGRSKTGGAAAAGDKPDTTTPITRKDIFVGPALETSPFTLDLFARKTADGKLTRFHTATYLDESDVSAITVKYLQPKKKLGPLLLLESGFTHWKSWHLIGYPDGVRGKRHFVQTFLWGGEGAAYIGQRFDKTDRRGFLLVEEVSKEDEFAREKTILYHWDGERFTDPQARYFVIAASLKTWAEAEAFVKKAALTLPGSVEIVLSDRYPKLRPGMWVVILFRCRTQQEANGYARGQNDSGRECYVKRAY